VVGVYALLDQTAPRLLAVPMLVFGTLVAVAGLVNAGRRVQRTRYRPDRWRAAELAVVVVGLAVAALGWWLNEHEVGIAYPPVTAAPEVSVLALVVGLLGAAAVAVTPPPRVAGTPR
jgi:energy-coupling factor transport system permease protein